MQHVMYVPPAHVSDSHRVDELVERDGKRKCKVLRTDKSATKGLPEKSTVAHEDRKALGAQSEGQDLEGINDQKSCGN
jgi:hypothetical protein